MTPLMAVRKVLILRSDRLGDIILSSGYLRALADQLPGAQLDLALAPDMQVCGRVLDPRLKVRPLPFDRYLRCPDESLRAWMEAVAAEDYDWLVVPQYTLGYPEMLALMQLSIPVRWGFRNHECGANPAWVTERLGEGRPRSDWVNAGPEVEEFAAEGEKYRQLAAAQGLAAVDLSPRLELPLWKNRRKSAKTLIWPGSADSRNRWPAESFTQLITLLAPPAVEIGATAGEMDAAVALKDALGASGRTARIRSVDPDRLDETADWLRSFALVLSNDTGIAHLAGAAGVKVVSISACPYQGRFVVAHPGCLTIFADVPCRRCRMQCVFDEQRFPCLGSISPAAVAAAVRAGGEGARVVAAEGFPEGVRAFQAIHASRRAVLESLEAERLHAHVLARASRRAEELVARTIEEQAWQAEQWSSGTAALQAKLEDAARSLDGWARRSGEAEGERDAWARRCGEAEQQRDGFAARLDEAEKGLARWQAAAEEAATSRDALNHERRAVAAALERSEASLQELQARTEEEARRLTQRAEQAESQREQWRSLSQAAEQQRDALQADLQAANDRERFQISQKESVIRELEETRVNLSEAEAELHEREIALSESHGKVTGLESDLQSSREANDLLAVRCEAAEAQVERFYRHFPWARTAPDEAAPLPKISIVTPSYEQGGFIEETIQSVIGQEYANFEHIIVDGGSRDQTVEILRKYPHLKWVSEQDKGQSHAINKGLLMSCGEIVAYLNSDDVYRPGAFHAVAEFFARNPEALMVVGDCDYINDDSVKIGHMTARFEKIEDLIRYWGWDRWYCIPQQAVFLRRELLSLVGLFDATLHMVMDYDMWLRVAERHPIHTLRRTLAAFRLAANTKTTSRTHLMYFEEFAASRKRWRLLPWRRRWVVAAEARRHLSSKLLDVGEHYAFNALHRDVQPSLLRGALRYWPPSLLSPRWLLSTAQVGLADTGAIPHIRRLHRAYLALKWRLRKPAGQ